MRLLLLLLLAVFVLVIDATRVASIVVNTVNGRVEGKAVAVNGATINVWYGIPFAKPPIGNLRFESPQPANTWTGVFDATRWPNICMQNQQFMPQWFPEGTRISEDCLNVNVFAPQVNASRATSSLPVMVWIYGGGFQTGAHLQYPGHFIAANDVVVVVPNYRVNVFGFLATPDGTIGGNMGLKDQTMALRWVRDNIANFGGDPSRVTIFGESAGAASVSLQLVSPMSKGLFHRAIFESGSDRGVWTINHPDQHPKNFVYQTASRVNCTRSTDRRMIACLRTKTASQILMGQNFTCHPGLYSLCSGYYAPIVDGPGGFLPKLPVELDAELHPDDTVPTISGITREDGAYFTTRPTYIPEAKNGGFNRTMFEFYLRRMLGGFSHGLSPDQFEIIYQVMRWKYVAWPDLDDEEANRQAINKLLTDYLFGHSWDSQAKAKSTKNQNTYGYIYAYMPTNASSSYPPWMGTFHSMDLAFVFGLPNLIHNNAVRVDSGMLTDTVRWSEDDIEFANYVMTLWTNFAKHSNPTPEPVKTPFSDTMLTWPMFSKLDQFQVMYIGTGVTTLTNYNQRNYALFTDLLKFVVDRSESVANITNLPCPTSAPGLKRKHGGRGKKLGVTGIPRLPHHQRSPVHNK